MRAAARLLAGVAGAILSASTAWALDAHPPQGPVWTEQTNGDAVQNDLGFILPATWKTFYRLGFSSTREDGASVKTHYLNGDGDIRLGILIQLRPDVRGVDFGPDLMWSMLTLSADVEYLQRTKEKPTQLSLTDFSLGNRVPAGRNRWVRYDLESGPEVQGMWWQNIGMWSVIITFSGPEAKRADIEAHANTLFAEMPFPSAPIATELVVVYKKLLAGMRKCQSRPEGAGAEVVPSFKEASALSILMPGLALGRANDSLITPVLRGQDYCLIETFDVRKDFPVTAIQYIGSPTSAWEARYGFILNEGKGGYYQVERFAGDVIVKMLDEPTAKHTYLNFSNTKRASVFAVFDDWPSYEAAKRVVQAIHGDPANRLAPVITMTQAADKISVVNNEARIQKAE